MTDNVVQFPVRQPADEKRGDAKSGKQEGWKLTATYAVVVRGPGPVIKEPTYFEVGKSKPFTFPRTWD